METRYKISYVTDKAKKRGLVVVPDKTEMKGIFLLAVHGLEKPFVYIRGQDNGLKQSILWPCLEDDTAPELSPTHSCSGWKFAQGGHTSAPEWMRKIATDHRADCTYFRI